jgi:hypothetical protein
VIASLRRHWFLIALAAAIFVLLVPFQAQAAFQRSASASTTVGTGTLSPGGSASAATNCGFLSQAYMTVTWTSATPSTYATGYLITPIANGTPQTGSTFSVSGRTTLSANNVPVNRSPLLGPPTYYTFRVQAVYQNWTSSAVTTTTPNLWCGAL